MLDDMPHLIAERVRKLYAGFSAPPPALDKSAVSARFRVPDDDVSALLASGLVTRFVGSHAHVTLFFTILELAKGRRRPILWSRDYLEQSDYQSEFSLDPCAQYTALVNDGTHAAAFDLKASYTQVKMPEDSNFVIIDEHGNAYRLERMPYGIDAASEIMQIIVEQLAAMSAAKADVVKTVKCKTHIDNVIGVSNAADVSKWADAVQATALKYRITLNDEPCNTPSRHLEFVGIDMNFGTKRVHLRKRFIDNLPTVEDGLRSYQDLESLVGKLMYAMAVLHIRQHEYHFFFKTWRRRLARLNRPRTDNSALGWREKPVFTSTVRGALERMVATVRKNEPVMIFPRRVATVKDLKGHQYTDVPIIVTDATLDGFGAVLYEKGTVVASVGGSFSQRAPSMAVAESAAAAAAIARFADRIRGCTFVLLIDNTTTENAVRNGFAKHASIDLAVDMIETMLADLNAKVLVARVASGDNVADAPSRAVPLKERCIQASAEAAQQAIAALQRTCVGDQVARRCRIANTRGGAGRDVR
jgi:hypothetical protein